MERTENIKKSTRRRRGSGGRIVKIKTEGKGLLPLKTALVVLSVAFQAGFLIFLHLEAVRVFWIYSVISYILSLIMCVHCLSSDRNGLSKAVWIIILLVGYSFGFVLYILSDKRIFFHRSKKRYNAVFKHTEAYCPVYSEPQGAQAVRNDCRYLYSAGKFAAHTGNKIRYFPSGTQLFDDVLERLESAEKFVFIEFFIIADGVLLNRVSDILEKKAKAGVDVRIIYDDMGCHSVLSHRMKKRLRRSGIKLGAYNKLLPRLDVGLNYRDHRKIIVIDGKTAYTGGANLADEYVNEKRMHGYWKDAGVRLDGSATDALSLIFLRQWEYITKRSEDCSRFFGNFEFYENGAAVAPYADGLEYANPIGKNMYENVIAGANKRVWIMTPYLIPDETVLGLLKNKSASGVDVRIILPAVPDKALTFTVTKNNAKKLVESGAKVYFMKNSFVHSKICLSENCAVIGSINFDLRSFYQQFECAVYTDDADVLSDVGRDFEATFLKSDEVDGNAVKHARFVSKVLAGLLQMCAPLM